MHNHPRKALALCLRVEPRSPAASALVEHLAHAVLSHERASAARSYGRGPAAVAKLRRAVLALAGGTLANAAFAGDALAPSFVPLRTRTFTGGPVAIRFFRAARAGLTALGLVEELPGTTDFHGAGCADTVATRFRATAPLWALAARFGVALPDAATEHFAVPAEAPKKPLTVRALSSRDGAKKARGATLAVPETEEAAALARAVDALNARLSAVAVTGCAPVRLSRRFTHDLAHGGRYYAAGASYQYLPKDRRAALLINGEAVACVDVHASALTLLYGLLGVPAPPAGTDLYGAVGGVARAVAKAWVNAAIGAGKPLSRWPAKCVAEMAEDGVPRDAIPKARVVGDAVLRAHPALARLPSLCADPDLPPLAGLRLQRLEADAMTRAMGALWAAGVPSLPMHDGLIVPASAKGRAKAEIAEAYFVVAGVVPTVREE